MRTIAELQKFLGVTADGEWGAKSQGAFDAVLHSQAVNTQPQGTISAVEHSVIASEFADAADIEAFRKCKARGRSDQDCFKVGDNGIGVWGDSTAPGSGPSCALPPEDMEEMWGVIANAKNRRVIVSYKDATATLVLKDRMPYRANIKNGAGIDLNEDARKILGIPKGGMVRVTWRWA
jgi:hypothetical protein